MELFSQTHVALLWGFSYTIRLQEVCTAYRTTKQGNSSFDTWDPPTQSTYFQVQHFLSSNTMFWHAFQCLFSPAARAPEAELFLISFSYLDKNHFLKNPNKKKKQNTASDIVTCILYSKHYFYFIGSKNCMPKTQNFSCDSEEKLWCWFV